MEEHILTMPLFHKRRSPMSAIPSPNPGPRKDREGGPEHEKMFKNFKIIGDMATLLRYSPARTGVASNG
jgi:hypothetical protein